MANKRDRRSPAVRVRDGKVAALLAAWPMATSRELTEKMFATTEPTRRQAAQVAMSLRGLEAAGQARRVNPSRRPARWELT